MDGSDDPHRSLWVSYNPFFRPRPRRFGTSLAEVGHILVAMLALAAILWIVFRQNEGYERVRKLPEWAIVAAALLISFLGFVLHELGHKFTAQHFGHWSEFRANFMWLGLGIFLAVFWHFPFAMPGATWHTAQDARDQGRISAMGPLVNFAIAFLALPFTGAFLDDTGRQLAGTVVFFSTFLGLFNLIPIGLLDGRKVIRWNGLVWALMVATGVGLLVYGFRASEFVRGL